MKKIFLLFLSVTSSVIAKDFGVIGHTIPIKENDIIEVIRDRADQISDEKKDLLQAKIRSRYEKKLRNPTSISIPETKTYSVHYFDPTITMGYDIKDHEDKIIIEKGTKHNPLTLQPLNRNLIFFNGDDAEQVEWAKKQDGAWILVEGQPLDLEEAEKRPVFFDQGGVLCKKFGIRSVPARISQYELSLKVEFILKGEES